MYIATNTCMYLYSSSAMHDNSYPSVYNYILDGQNCVRMPHNTGSELACPLHENTKFNLISYIAKYTLELASKETPMSSRAFCKGKHLGIKIAWVYSLGYVSIQSIHCSLAPL